MKRRSGWNEGEYSLREKIIGLGERSIRKSYYPQLQREAEYLKEKSAALEQMLEDLEEAKRRLQEGESRYRSVFENTGTATVIIEEDGTVTLANDQFAALCGYTREEIEGRKSWIEFVAEKDREKTREYYHRRRLDPRGTPARHECDLVDRNGEVRNILLTVNMITGTSQCVASLLDITERKRADMALRESEEKYRLLVANAGEAILIVQDGDIRFLNRKCLEMTGYSEEELLESRFADLVHPDDRGMVLQRYEERLRGEREPETYAFRILNKAVEEIWVQLCGARITWEGRPADLAFLQDITEQKKLEAQFVQAQKMEAVGRLAGGIAHDFNNMIGAILGYCDLILPGLREGDPLYSDIMQIKICAERSAALTRQLLAFSRKQILVPKVLNFSEVVEEFKSVLSRLIGEHIKLQIIRRASLGFVKADHGQIEQIIMNLAVNARDAMPDGGKLTIEIENVQIDERYAATHIGATSGPHVMLAVTDTGCGMAPETLSRIFEPFFTTKEPSKGTGLGLSTVYGIVKQSGGSIWVYSELGKGTTFKLYFPRVEGARTEMKPVRPDALRGAGETVLVVEDSDALRNLVVQILARGGYRVVAARNGGEALLTCERFPGRIELLLTDVVMPQMGGRELANRLTQSCSEMKVLYMSGYTDSSITHNGMLEAGVHFIQKPFNVEALLAKVREVLRCER